MKKIILSVLILGASLGGFSIVHAEGCFHDAIEVVDEAGEISQGANVRNVACILGSEVIGTLKAGTKVRIIGKTAWTKIVYPDGKVGWVGNAYIKSSTSWTNVPAMVANHKVDSYCDTTNITRCPNPSAVGEVPTFYTTSSTTSTTTTTTTTLTTAKKKLVEEMVTIFMSNLEKSVGDDIQAKITRLSSIITVLRKTTFRSTVQPMIDYLVQKLLEQKMILLGL